MCRLVAYLSQKVVFANEVINKPCNSLVHQSKHAKSGLSRVNADGFGVGWYDFSVEEAPSAYRSIQPAWNDLNLVSLSSKLKTHCFIGHVRASTVGDVAIFNCHPFVFRDTLFAHNGTIKDFSLIKQQIVNILSLENYSLIRGQTDSEHFFALIHHYLSFEPQISSFSSAVIPAIKKSINLINDLKAKAGSLDYTRLNFVLTNGKEMIAVRYSTSFQIQPLMMHYKVCKEGETVYIASEPLDEVEGEWKEIPDNHIFLIGQDLKISFLSIENS